MTKKLEYKNVEELLAEADELVRRIHSEVIKDMEEEHRRQFEKHTENYNTIKAGVQEHIDKHGSWDVGSGAEGMHQAIQAIVQATQDLKSTCSDSGTHQPALTVLLD